MEERRVKNQYRNVAVNTFYFVAVFALALAIASQALARRVNTYEITKQPLLFSVSKEKVVISNAVTGRVDEVPVTIGQHVRKGDLLVRLSDDTLAKRLDTLRNVSEDNLSARTELELLQTQTQAYEIRAPRDGVIYQIDVAEGSYLNSSTAVLTLFADTNVKLVGSVSPTQYAEIQKNKDLDVYADRFEQVYKVTFQGVGRVVPGNRYDESKYEVQFRFADDEDGAAFIEGETLEVVSPNQDNQASRPSLRLTRLWNKLMGQK